MTDTALSRTRVGFGLAAPAALLIAVVFLTLGDWSDATADGWRGPVLEYGHAAVWLLLAGLGVAAFKVRWTSDASLMCAVRGVGYLVVLGALLTS
jgi:hypothetical protein